MKQNVGSTDKIIRIVAAVLFAALYFTGTVTGTVGMVLLVLGGIFLATSLISFCPIYAILGMSTCPVPKK
jgi:hypothetical protein